MPCHHRQGRLGRKDSVPRVGFQEPSNWALNLRPFFVGAQNQTPMNDFWNEFSGPPLSAEAEEFLAMTVLILGTIFLIVTLIGVGIRRLTRRK